jgi:tryptophanyl-tRNA synthetase
MKKRILTGDRPTGPLHIGHYVGSLANRIKLQDEYEQFVMIADVQALTDNYDNPQKVRDNIMQLALDYISVGIDPAKTTIFVQSQVPAIAELTVFYMNLVTIARLQRNPTVKDEMKQKGMIDTVTLGFLAYPVSQAADITSINAHLVPVGEDQVPMIEQTREIVRKFNSLYGETLVEPEALVGDFPRLVGTDGNSKMSKSIGNTIYLSDSKEEVERKVRGMYTDPNRLKATDQGTVEGNPVFIYLDAFGLESDKGRIDDLKKRYREGSVGDVEVKGVLIDVLETFLQPIRTRRQEAEKDLGMVEKMLQDGTERANDIAQQTLTSVKKAMKIDYFS